MNAQGIRILLRVRQHAHRIKAGHIHRWNHALGHACGARSMMNVRTVLCKLCGIQVGMRVNEMGLHHLKMGKSIARKRKNRVMWTSVHDDRDL
jgi:hypothetical protein